MLTPSIGYWIGQNGITIKDISFTGILNSHFKHFIIIRIILDWPHDFEILCEILQLI